MFLHWRVLFRSVTADTPDDCVKPRNDPLTSPHQASSWHPHSQHNVNAHRTPLPCFILDSRFLVYPRCHVMSCGCVLVPPPLASRYHAALHSGDCPAPLLQLDVPNPALFWVQTNYIDLLTQMSWFVPDQITLLSHALLKSLGWLSKCHRCHSEFDFRLELLPVYTRAQSLFQCSTANCGFSLSWTDKDQEWKVR